MKQPPMPNDNKEQRFRELIRDKKFSEEGSESEFNQLAKELGNEVADKILKEEGYDFEKYFQMFTGYIKGLKDLGSAFGDARKELDGLINPSNTRAVGELLMAHLKIEYLIEKILIDNIKKSNNSNPIKRAKLSFVQKINLLPIDGWITDEVIEYLNEINRFRNCFVHDVKFDACYFKSKVLSSFFDQEKCNTAEDKFNAMMKVIKAVEILLLVSTPSFKKELEAIMENHPVLTEIGFYTESGGAKSLQDFLLRP